MTDNKILDEMVRDFTQSVPRSKSEVRRRIKQHLLSTLEDLKGEKVSDEQSAIQEVNGYNQATKEHNKRIDKAIELLT